MNWSTTSGISPHSTKRVSPRLFRPRPTQAMRQAAVTRRWVEIVAAGRGLIRIQVRRLFRSARALEQEAARVLAEKATLTGQRAYLEGAERPTGETLFDMLARRAYDDAAQRDRQTARAHEREAFRAM